MSLPVVWTPEAESTFQTQLDYLEEHTTESTLRQFIDRVFEAIDRLTEHPEMYQVYRANERIRYGVINPSGRLWFRYD